MSIRERGRGARGRARGTLESTSTNPKISIRFEPDMFERINVFAEQSKCSFNDAVRLLVGHAFACLDKEEADAVQQSMNSEK